VSDTPKSPIDEIHVFSAIAAACHPDLWVTQQDVALRQAEELTALRSDISRHVQAAADLANEVAELRAMLSDDPHNVPSAFVQFGGVTYRVWGTSSISAFEKMQAQLAELRAENEMLRKMQPVANVQLTEDAEYWKAEAERLREDAERYRWLRVNSTQPAEGWSTHSSPESLDAEIDAARKEGK